MEKYSSYRDSGIYFLPELPSSWKIRKAKYLFNEENRPVSPGDEIVTCFRDGQVTLRKNRRLDGFTNSMKEIGYQGVRKGDLVIHNMDAFAGAIGVSDSDGKSTPVYSCCTPKSGDVNQYYYCYLLGYLARSGFILSLAKGIRERSTDFRFNDFKELYLPLPSPEEQKAIVAYLDAATAKIDEAIAQQQRMIDLLNERKELLIENEVTKGIKNGTWKTRRLRHVCKFRSGYTPSKNVTAYWENGTIPWFRMEDIHLYGRKLSQSEQYITPSAVKGDGLFKAGSFILATSATVGEHALLLVDALSNQRFTNLALFEELSNELSTEYFFYFLYHIDRECRGFTNGSTFASVSNQDLKNILVGIPSPEEQRRIVSMLDTETFKIDNALELVSQQIQFLQERKQIIINDVVIGKVRIV